MDCMCDWGKSSELLRSWIGFWGPPCKPFVGQTGTLPKLKYLFHRCKFPSEMLEVENGFAEGESGALELEIHPAFEVFSLQRRASLIFKWSLLKYYIMPLLSYSPKVY